MNTGQIIMLGDGIRDEIERARESDDIGVIREHLVKAIEGLDVLVNLAKSATPPLEDR